MRRSANKLFKSGVKPDAVAAVGLSGQMHTSVFLDKHRKVIRPALLAGIGADIDVSKAEIETKTSFFILFVGTELAPSRTRIHCDNMGFSP